VSDGGSRGLRAALLAERLARFALEGLALGLLWLLLFALLLMLGVEITPRLARVLLWSVCGAGLAAAALVRRAGGRAGVAAGWVYGPPLAVVAVGGAWTLFGGIPAEAPLLRAASTALPGTAVLVHPALPIPAGKNALWCASAQFAWDALRRGEGRGTVALGPPAPPPAVAALNASDGAACGLPDAAWAAMAGRLDGGFEPRVNGELARKFGSGAPRFEFPPVPAGAVAAVAYLERNLPFEHPFEAREQAMSFAGGPKRVRAWGLNPGSRSPGRGAMLDQVRYAAASATDRRSFVLEFTFKGGGDRMLVAPIQRGESLAATWRQAEAALAAAEKTRFRAAVLAVPKLNFEILHDFREFDGALLHGEAPIALMRQVTRFRLDERGALLRSWHVTLAAGGVPSEVVVDRPFLLALRRSAAAEPYFLLWVENDELLVRD
jgi:hypothetical protein